MARADSMLRGIVITLVVACLGTILFIIIASINTGYIYYNETVLAVVFALCAFDLHRAQTMLQAGNQQTAIDVMSRNYYILLFFGVAATILFFVMLFAFNLLYIATLVLSIVADVCVGLLRSANNSLVLGDQLPLLD